MDKVAPDIDFMRLALDEAEKAYQEGEVPVGAVLVLGGEVMASAHKYEGIVS